MLVEPNTKTRIALISKSAGNPLSNSLDTRMQDQNVSRFRCIMKLTFDYFNTMLSGF